MKALSILLAMLISTHGYACTLKDYECIKQKQIQSHAPTQKYNHTIEKTYRHNEKIYVNGSYDSSAVHLDDTYNHNVYVRSHNTNIRSNHGTGTLVSIDSNSKHNKIHLDVSGNLTTDVRNLTSLDTCVSLVCNQSDNTNGIKIRVNNANVNTTIK